MIPPQQTQQKTNPFCSWKASLVAITWSAILLGCPQDNNPLQVENHRLKKQIAKQESVIHSLQEGNKIMQQQIDLLNQESREETETLQHELQRAQEKISQLIQGHQKENAQLKALQTENRKLAGTTKWLRSQREQLRKGLWVSHTEGYTEELSFPFSAVIDGVEMSLKGNGYTVIASMQTDQNAVYVTKRKNSPPTSLELSGFRNQFIVGIEKEPGQKSRVRVQADFEKLSEKGTVLKAGPEELREIELRLIHDIRQSLEKETKEEKVPTKDRK